MKTIFLIDDDPVVARVYGNRLKSEGYHVAVISDGEGALQMMKEVNPTAILLDLMLPGMDGIEVIHQLRQQKSAQALPIIVLTNSYLEKNIAAVKKAGANHCLSKAKCTPRLLIDLIDQALGRIKLSPEALANLAALPKRATIPILSTDAALSHGRRDFFVEWPKWGAELRAAMQALIKADPAAQPEKLLTLYLKVRPLTAATGLCGLLMMSDTLSALEALLKELTDHPKKNTLSTMRTIAATIDFVFVLAEKRDDVSTQIHAEPQVLVADDDPISRKAVTQALGRAKLNITEFESSQAALGALRETTFDLAVLDVQMPEMDGFELCRQIRTLPNNAKTPVIFVTSLTDFQNRAQSSLSGGNDFIAKPFVLMELAVKALIFIHKKRLEQGVPQAE